MGCDIHGTIEVYMGRWLCALNITDFSPRNYTLFSNFFGVRGPNLLPYKDRGFPDGISWGTKGTFCEDCDGAGHPQAAEALRKKWLSYRKDTGYCQKCQDYHSVSYLTIREVNKHQEPLEKCIGDSARWLFVFDMMECYNLYIQQNGQEKTAPEDDGSTVRLIVWFDN